MPETRSHRTRESSSELYDSRKVPRARGIGYPSCNTELARLPPNTQDPHGYYAAIGVHPWASEAEIRSAVRSLLYRLHPDTGSGNVERFQRIRNIAEVLLDPLERDKYNRTPVGKRLMDKVYEAELSKLGELNLMDEDEVRRVLQPQKANPYRGRAGRYDYFALGHNTDPWQADALKAQLWYHFLVDAAPMVGYRRVIKVVMTSGQAHYLHEASMMIIPRSWEPSAGLAYSLFTVVAGFRPGRTDPDTTRPFTASQMSG